MNDFSDTEQVIRTLHKPYIPKGCDMQGRTPQPQPAEACTEVGIDEDPLAPARGFILGAAISLAMWSALVLWVVLR